MESEPGSSTQCGIAVNQPTEDEALLDEMVEQPESLRPKLRADEHLTTADDVITTALGWCSTRGRIFALYQSAGVGPCPLADRGVWQHLVAQSRSGQCWAHCSPRKSPSALCAPRWQRPRATA